MQAQEAPSLFWFKIWPLIEENKKLIFTVAAVVLGGTLIFSYVSWHAEQQEIQAGQDFTAAMLSQPTAGSAKQFAENMLTVANRHPGTSAAVRAQLQAATAFYVNADYADAQAQFQKLLDSNPESFFRATASLGVAASLEAQGKTDQAIAAYQTTAAYSDSAAAESANFALGRLYESQGKWNDAADCYRRLTESTSSDLANEAGLRYSLLKTKLTSVKPATTTPAVPLMTPAAATH